MSADSATTRYTVAEEIANAVSHGIGAILSIIGLEVLLAFAARYGDIWHIVSCSIYGTTLIMLYTASTLYHSIWHPKTKQILRQFDHAAIFLLIAGTYTPFTLVNLRGDWGWTLFILVWSIAIVGLILEIATKQKYKKLSLGLYLGLGWLVVAAIKPMIDHIATGGLILILMGGLFCSLGVVFYVWKRLAFHHAIWHLFVLGGSICHFFAVLFYVIPDAGSSL
jgi:hemolysin III